MDKTIHELRILFKSQKDPIQGVTQLMNENTQLRKQLDSLKADKAMNLKNDLLDQSRKIGDMNFIAAKVDLEMDTIRDLAFKMNQEMGNLVLLLASDSGGKINLSLLISEELAKSKNLNAGVMIREIAKEIGGGGGGQPHFATAGGKNPEGLDKAFQKALQLISG
jgi:alanyl-tRNA synthetase